MLQRGQPSENCASILPLPGHSQQTSVQCCNDPPSPTIPPTYVTACTETINENKWKKTKKKHWILKWNSRWTLISYARNSNKNQWQWTHLQIHINENNLDAYIVGKVNRLYIYFRFIRLLYNKKKIGLLQKPKREILCKFLLVRQFLQQLLLINYIL